MISVLFPRLRVGIESLRHSLLQSLTVGQITEPAAVIEHKKMDENMSRFLASILFVQAGRRTERF